MACAMPCVNSGSYELSVAGGGKQASDDLVADVAHILDQHKQALGSHSLDGGAFTPGQGACANGPLAVSSGIFSPFSSFQRATAAGAGGAASSTATGDAAAALGLINSDGSSGSDMSAAGVSASPIGASVAAGYSPFMGAPWGNSLGLMPGGESAGPTGPAPLELPMSPMSPGIVFNPTPTAGTPSSPRALFQGAGSASFGGLSSSTGGVRTLSGSLQQLPPPGFSNNAAVAAAAAADAVAAQGLPPFYFNAAAAAAAGSTSPLQAALNQTLLNQHTAASLAAQQQQAAQQQAAQQAAAVAAAAAAQQQAAQQAQQQQQLLQASLSMALANQAAAASNPFMQNYSANLLSALEPMRSAGGSLSLDGGLQQQASMTALLQQHQHHQQQLAAAIAAQQQHAASQLRRNMSTPAGVAAQLGLGGAAQASAYGLASAASLGAGGGPGMGLAPHAARLHVTHSADLTHLDAMALLGGPMGGAGGMVGGRPKFNKARKNSEPKIGPDGQPRLNARQRRTLRRAKERALKGLLEVSQALLQKAEVQVTVPNISHLTALEELAAVEAEKEAAHNEAHGGGDGCLSPGGSGGLGGGKNGASGALRGAPTRSQQLAAAAAAVEESVCEIARAAVAAVSAQANGRDTSSAAAAAKAAAAQAASAAASAGAVLPPGYVMPEVDEGGSDELQPCNSDPLDGAAAAGHHSVPTSPVGSNVTAGNPSSCGRSSSSSTSSLPGSARCSTSSAGSSAGSSAASALASAGKPPLGQPPRPASTTAASVPSSSPMCSPLPSPTPSCGLAAAGASPAPASGGAAAGAGAAGAAAAGAGGAAAPKAGGSAASQLEGIDIASLIGQLSLKKDEGMVDDKLIRDLQIIQSLIGALKAPAAGTPGGSLDGSGGSGALAGGGMLLGGGGPSAGSSPVPHRHPMQQRPPLMGGGAPVVLGGGGPKALPKQRCNSPGGMMGGGALQMM